MSEQGALGAFEQSIRTILRFIAPPRRLSSARGARGTRQVTVREAMLMKFTENALKGDPRALLTLIALNEKSRASGRGAGVHMPVSAEDLALLNSFVERSAKDAVLKPKDDEKLMTIRNSCKRCYDGVYLVLSVSAPRRFHLENSINQIGISKLLRMFCRKSWTAKSRA